MKANWNSQIVYQQHLIHTFYLMLWTTNIKYVCILILLTRKFIFSYHRVTFTLTLISLILVGLSPMTSFNWFLIVKLERSLARRNHPSYFFTTNHNPTVIRFHTFNRASGVPNEIDSCSLYGMKMFYVQLDTQEHVKPSSRKTSSRVTESLFWLHNSKLYI